MNNGHRFSHDQAVLAGSKGASRLRDLLGEEGYRIHMSEIGKRGGQVTSRDRVHMSVIGNKGGAATLARNASKSDR